MPGKIFATIVSIAMFTFVALTMSFFFIHTSIATRVNELNYNAVELASTSGELSSETFEYLMHEVNKYSAGDENNQYFARVKLEKRIVPGVYDTFFETSETNPSKILNTPLDVGDRISIYLEDRTPTIFGRLINSAFLGYAPSKLKDIRISSLRSAVIVNRKSNAVKGYDIIADIKTRNYSNPNAKIQVITKLSAPICTEYENNIYNISDPTIPQYIFPAGEFLKEEDTIGGVLIIKYVQQ